MRFLPNRRSRRLRPLLPAFALSGAALLASVSLAGVAEAQTTVVEGFSVNRFDPADRGGEWFALDSLDLRGHLRPAAGAMLDWAHKPLVLYDAQGEEQRAIVSNQLFVHIGGGVNLWDTLRLSLDIPIAAVNSGETGYASASAGSPETLQYSAPNGRPIGDLRLSATYRLAGAFREKLTLALNAHLYLPTGTAAGYTGDDSVRFSPGLEASGAFVPKGSVPPITYAARLGLMVRPNEAVGFSDATGTEVQFAAAAGVQLLDRRLTVGPEVFGSSVVSQSGAFLGRRATPLEVLVGAHMAIPAYKPIPDGFKGGVAIGPGFTHGAGTPLIRVLATIEWTPPIAEVKEAPKPGDRDKDFIVDPEDDCPDDAGPASSEKGKNGCPPPKPKPGDKDGDRIIDLADACPDQPGPPNDNPKKHGCPPPPDRDADTIPDPQDACPDEAGPPNEKPTLNGCPPPKDRDQDTFLDPVDACPDAPGVASDDPKKNGCPMAIIEKGQIRILDQVKFATGSAKILKESDPILQAVAKILTDNPGIAKVRIEGHTDNKGTKIGNKMLSKSRADSVMKWLTAHGIDKKRLVNEGLGQEKPIATNDTEEGRKENRRVEFHIVEEIKK